MNRHLVVFDLVARDLRDRESRKEGLAVPANRPHSRDPPGGLQCRSDSYSVLEILHFRFPLTPTLAPCGNFPDTNSNHHPHQSTRPRGARPRARASRSPARGFNPRARVGRDGSIPLAGHGDGFQSTRPRGARPCPCRWSASRGRFNPRARVGRDLIGRHNLTLGVFQSTRPRGARPPGVSSDCGLGSFNPRARVGRDRSSKPSRKTTRSFNPRARVGRDTNLLAWVWFSEVSIHAPAWGATRR